MTLVSGDFTDAFKETETTLGSIETLSDDFEDTLRENFYLKNTFININGLSARILGINSLNERQKLANGHLTDFETHDYVDEISENVIDLNAFLSERNIDFIYLLAPSKRAFYDVEFAPGYGKSAKYLFDEMLERVENAGIKTIDMNAYFEDNKWTMDDVYYRTDHHWRSKAAFSAVQITMEKLEEDGIAYYDKELLDEDNWDIVLYPNWLLGSHGKRTGSLYAGTDDFYLYTPKFETNYSYSFLLRDSADWKYKDNILNTEHFDEPDYFNDTPYVAYMYGDKGLRITKNSLAPNSKRILLMGDSYKMPYEYFLTTEFSEVYTLDLRYYQDNTVAEYVGEINPDIVIMCTDSVSDLDIYKFGVGKYNKALESTDDNAEIIDLGSFELTKEASNKNCVIVCTDLKPNQTYTLTLDSTYYSGGNDKYVQMTLYNETSDEAIYNRYFDANSNERQKWIFKTPEENKGKCAVYLYAGVIGHTKNVEAAVENVKIQEGINEN